jgi:stress response protein YsnF
MEGPPISEAEHEVTLYEERPVVSKQAVPKERVRLDTDTVTEQRRVSDELRREQIDAESADAGHRRR